MKINNSKYKQWKFITKVLFIHQPLDQWVVLKNNIKIHINIYIKTVPTYFVFMGGGGGLKIYFFQSDFIFFQSDSHVSAKVFKTQIPMSWCFGSISG